MDKTEIQQLISQAIQLLTVAQSALGDEGWPDFLELKALLASDRWPEAVNASLICDPTSEAEKSDRGRGIVELVVSQELSDQRFLDFGCGEGYCTLHVADKRAALAVGYDPHDLSWRGRPQRPNLLFTDSWEIVTSNAPYDTILAFDVIDHLVGDEPTAVLAKMKEVLAPEGRIFLRAHPFTSRHATHLYHKCNKAYPHLSFSSDELYVMGLTESVFNAGVVFPLNTYKGYFEAVGLQIIDKQEIREPVEAFFRESPLAERIVQATTKDKFPEFQLGLQFIDYVLSH